MSIRYGEDVFRSVELPLIRAMLDVLPMAAQHTSALHDVEKRHGADVGAELASEVVHSTGKVIWDSFRRHFSTLPTQIEMAEYVINRSKTAKTNPDQVTANSPWEFLKTQYNFTDEQVEVIVIVFEQLHSL